MISATRKVGLAVLAAPLIASVAAVEDLESLSSLSNGDWTACTGDYLVISSDPAFIL